MSMMMTSMPLPSPPSYLYVHMPSVFSFQNAPVALCIPRRPTCGLPSVAVAALPSPPSALVLTDGSSAAVLVPRDLFICDVGTRCCTMVLLMANLNDGADAPDGVDSEMTALSIAFCGEGSGYRQRLVRMSGGGGGECFW